MNDEHFDVLIVGAGISGIGAAYHLQKYSPTRSYAILEGRENIGGTWDLFRYPGIRSDSDMYTLGYRFKPWIAAKAIADGPSILDYLNETIEENGIDRHIRFHHHVNRASWSTEDAQWTVESSHGDDGALVRYTCNFLFMCSGYYDYAKGYTPDFPGIERFQGEVYHPQFWTDEIDCAGKRVVVIGSGATAVTLVPELAKDAAHVTMLQRSPTYMASRPGEDKFALALQKHLPQKLAYATVRWRNVLMGALFYWFCQRYPQRAKTMLQKHVRHELGQDYDVDRHFSPRYNPWDQRLCLVLDGDLFEAVKSDRASVLTDHIATFTQTGIQLESGESIDADLVVTATGLKLQLMSDLEITVDGRRVDASKALAYKSMMLSDVPNLALSFGYTNASWTLKSDLTCEFVCRLLNHMDKHGYDQCCARVTDDAIETLPMIDLKSGYVMRYAEKFPKQGSKAPWRLYQNYILDILTIRYGRLNDGVMTFSKALLRRPRADDEAVAAKEAA
jgi:cation diffusion facilitator CzcD-associated flavoprotein CzcO